MPRIEITIASCYCLVMDLYLSCPANELFQNEKTNTSIPKMNLNILICSSELHDSIILATRNLRANLFVNSTPTVEREFSLNSSFLNLFIKVDFPTLESPIKITRDLSDDHFLW